MFVTCYSDSSYHVNRSGYAIWLRCYDGRYKRASICPSGVDSSVAAEMFAIYASAYYATRVFKNSSFLLLRSDCQSAIDILTTGRTINQTCKYIYTLFRERIKTNVKFKWVQGHRLSKAPDAFINSWCDMWANRARTLNDRVSTVETF